MKKFKIKVEGETFEVSVTEQEKGMAEVSVNGKPYIVEFERENDASIPKSAIARKGPKNNTSPTPEREAAPIPRKSTGGSAKSIKSPLPGNIFKIPVSVGQEVKKGDQIIVIESMKMENNIMADKDGIVRTIHVQVGQSVLQGDPLMDLE